MRISDWSSDVCSSDLGPDPTSIGSVDFGFAYDAGIDLRKIKVGYSPAWFGSVDFGSTRDATGHDLNGLLPANPGPLAGLEAMRAPGVGLVEVRLPDMPLAHLPIRTRKSVAVGQRVSVR